MAATYTPIASVILNADASSVTFSNIPQTYTDLILIINGSMSAGENSLGMRFNNDSGSNYSSTAVYGSGSSALSLRQSNDTQLYIGRAGTVNSISTIHIQNYSNTTTWKTLLSRGSNTSIVMATVNLWRSTAAITSFLMKDYGSNNFASGTTFNLYGILGANA